MKSIEAGKRIKQLMKEKGVTQKELADMVKIPQSVISDAINGKREIDKLVNNVAEKFNVSRDYLISGSEFSELSQSVQKKTFGKSAAEIVESKEQKPHIPTEVAAGTTTGIADAVTLGLCEMKPVVKMIPNYDFTITIKGNSMEPKYEGGDIIAIKKVYDYIKWGETYVLDTHDGAVLKRIYDDGDKFRCVSYNNEYPDFTVDKECVNAVYRVVGLVRSII